MTAHKALINMGEGAECGVTWRSHVYPVF